MKPLVLIFSTLLLFSCGTRKADLQREINTYKTELSAQKKKNSETDSMISNVQKMFNAVIEQNLKSREEWQKQLQELAESYQSKSSELAEDVQISGAVGTVKLTDNKGNLYEIPSDAGTTIKKNASQKSATENKEIRQAFLDERKSNEVLQQDIQRLQNREENYQSTLRKSENEIANLKEKISTLEKSKNKTTESKRPAFAWYVLAFVFGMISFRFLQVQIPNFLQYLNNKR